MTSNKYSAHKIVWFHEKMESFAKGTITAPIYVRVKPTNACNHSCFFCVYKPSFSGMHELSPDREDSWQGEVAQLKTLKLLELLHDFDTIGVKAVTYSGGGEPLMHPDIVSVMERTLELDIDLSIITNGQALNGARANVLRHAKWVRVSVDYHTAQQMQDHRGVNPRMFKTLLDNLSNFAAEKEKSCNLFVNYIVHKDNCDGLYSAAKLFKEHGVENVRFSPMWIPGFKAYHTAIKDRVEQILQAAQTLRDENFSVNSTYDLDSPAHQTQRAYRKCYFSQVVPVVAADGNVYACHNKAYDKKGLIGSIADQKFSQLWFSPETKAFFDRLNPAKDCCHQCANDDKNLFIHELLAARGDNFV